MPIFELIVKDQNHPSWWGFAPVVSKIVVRAASRSAARDIAMDGVKWEPQMEGQGRNRRMPEYPDDHPIQAIDATDCELIEPDGPDCIIGIVKL